MSGSCSGRHRLLIHSARQVVQVSATGETALTGARRMNSLALLEQRHDGQGLSIVVDRLALASGVTGRTAPGDTLQGGYTRRKTNLWANLQRIVEKRGRTGKKGVG